MIIDRLRNIIEKSNNIVFFGGAGTSTESNIPDFRSSSGLYTTSNNLKFSPEYMLSHTCFMKHTTDFYNYYKSNMIYTKAKPNLAHIALTKLEKAGKLKAIITQNIDGLHQLSGSENVIELHGSVYRNYCIQCNSFYNLDHILKASTIPTCEKCGGIVKPDVVLYEEGLDAYNLNNAIKYIQNADVLIVGGTSLTVYPAAGLIDNYYGNKLILINKSKTHVDNRALLFFNDNIGKVLDEAIDY